jgi:DNA polymerase III subunit alpha
MNHSGFVHLHLHSHFSLLESTIRFEPLMAQLKLLGQPAVALTDKANLFGAIAFYQVALAHGVKPILGCEIWVSSENDRLQGNQKPEAAFPLVLLAENEEGYRNLMKLSSKAYLRENVRVPQVTRDLLGQYCRGLIALSGGFEGEMDYFLQIDELSMAIKVAGEYQEMFGEGNFFLEIQNHKKDTETKAIKQLVEISKKNSIPLVATNSVRYLQAQDAAFHEVLLCMGRAEVLSDPKHFSYGSDQYYLKSADEMGKLFQEIPEALNETVRIAERCHVVFEFEKVRMPSFKVPDANQTEDSYLEKLCREGAQKRYGSRALDSVIQVRLQEELRIIRQTGFSGYFLIVWDFITKTKSMGIPVGPGRGSAAGSLVSFLLGITDVDPIRYDLLFERFINPERVSAPDIDVDVCDRRRQEVLDYIMQTYGKDRVASIITFGTMAAKAVVRDVGRVLEIPLPEVDHIAKLIPAEPKVTLEDAASRVPELNAIAMEQGPFRKLWDVSRALEGLVRHVSTHAAGLIIGNEPLLESIPLCRGAGGEILTQYDMNALKDVGLLKLDVLGLRTLTVIQDTIDLVRRTRHLDLQAQELPLEDATTYKLLKDAKTMGVFQLESRGMRDYLRKLEPKNIEDLIALLALYRPGPLGSDVVDNFIHRKKGLVDVEYPHPKTIPILETTHGVILYQEQVMRIAKDLAGFTLGEADLLRRAMGSKNPEQMEKMRGKFLDGAVGNQIPADVAEDIFNLMLKFAGYGFNKSHSTAYALLAYQTAYLKAHFTTEFMAALLTSEIGDQDKISQYIFDCKKSGIKVLPPDVNQSSDVFTVLPNREIRYALTAIKNVGTPAVQSILKARGTEKPFESLSDFCQRVDLKSFSPKMVESLISAGAFDFCGQTRSALKAMLEKVFRRSQVDQAASQRGQTTLFETLPSEKPELPPVVEEESPIKILSNEKDVLGFYLSGHPLSEHDWELEHYATPLHELEELPGGFDVRVAGLIRNVAIGTVKKTNETYGRIILEDLHSHVDAIAWPETYKKFQALLTKDKLVALKGRLEKFGDHLQVIVQEAIDINEMAVKWAKAIRLTLNVVGMDDTLLAKVKNVCEKHPGKAKVYFHMQTPHHGLVVLEADHLQVKPGKVFLKEIYALLGEDSIEIEL